MRLLSLSVEALTGLAGHRAAEPGHSVAPPATTFDLTILVFTHASGYFVVLVKCWREIFGANAVAFVAYCRYKLPFLERQVSVM